MRWPYSTACEKTANKILKNLCKNCGRIVRKLWKDFCSVLNQKDLFYFKKYLKKILGKVAPEVKKLWNISVLL